jgi:hypothetical protein
MGRQEHREVEPLFAALDEEPSPRRAAARSTLLWKLVVAALVLAALLAIVLNQAF